MKLSKTIGSGPSWPVSRGAILVLAVGCAVGALGLTGCGKAYDSGSPAAQPSGGSALPDPSVPAPAKAAVKPYPVDFCLVSGDKLGAMGTPPSIVYQGQEIKFCCPGCIPEFRKDPAKYLKKLPQEGNK